MGPKKLSSCGSGWSSGKKIIYGRPPPQEERNTSSCVMSSPRKLRIISISMFNASGPRTIWTKSKSANF